MKERVYIVTNTTTGEQFLRVATHPHHALKHVVTEHYTVHAASAIETSKLIIGGVLPITVKEEKPGHDD